MDFSALAKVEVFGPGVPVVADELHFTSDSITTKLILEAIVDVLTRDVVDDDCRFENPFQCSSHVVNYGASLMNSLLPLLYFLVPSCGQPPASVGAFEVVHNSPADTIEVTVSHWGEAGRVRVSDGV